MSKIIKISFPIFFFLAFLIRPNSTYASCIAKNGSCPPTGNVFICSNTNGDFCCSESSTECLPNGSNSKASLEDIEKSIGLGQGDAAITNYDSFGSIISGLLPYLLTLAGMILLVMLISGAFTMLSGAANQESQEKGKQQITTAILGFLIIFAAYWIAQIIQVVFKVNVVGNQPTQRTQTQPIQSIEPKIPF